MPITKTSTITHTLMSLNLDMGSAVMVCGFARQIDGVLDTNIAITIAGTDFATLLATQAAAGQALSDEITVAIYNYAVAKGLITGTVA